jgi:hypothetical protein
MKKKLLVVFMYNFKEPKRLCFFNKTLIYEGTIIDKAIY